MAAPRMDPQYEQWLREEVIYLHSLWHQGPPGAATAASASAPVVRHHLQPHKPTQFKKKNKGRSKIGKNLSHSSSGAEWPCPPSPPRPPPTAGWPAPKPDPKPLPLSSEEQEKLAAKHAHHHALKVVGEFLKSNNGNDDDELMDSSSDEDDDELVEGDCGREDYSFFFKVFKEDAELREYYEKNFAGGEFNCLVCGALGGKKMGKKFKGCLALVQHSITIAKTKKRRAHRAFGQAVCKVLGWSIDKLPTIVSMLSDKSGKTEGNDNSDNKETSVALVSNVENLKDDTVEGRNDEAVPETGIPLNGDGDTNPWTSSFACKNVENIGTVHTHNAEESASDKSTINSIACPNTDKKLENLGIIYLASTKESASQVLTINSLTSAFSGANNENIGFVHQHNMVQPAPEGSMINSLTRLDANGNLENLGLVHPHNVEDPVTSVPLDENIRIGKEMQDSQMG